MTLSERFYGVWLRELRVGTLTQHGDHTRFALAESYLDDVNRPVLGLLFEQDLTARYASASRLPPWFSNLLPEGKLRDWIAHERQVPVQREMELLAQVGHDLPGAVRIRPVETADVTDDGDWEAAGSPPQSDPSARLWRFSLAGVALKFSMLADSDRLTLPATGVGGDWIVKLPDRVYPDVPRNEYAMMTLAKAAGIDVPEVRLIHRDDVVGLPDGVWPVTEDWAYAVKRFDRTESRGLVHIEDLAQVRNVYPSDKYLGNYETIGSLLYRGHDEASLREFARRLVFCILVSNGDAHLKNWSLVYRDPRVPQISPAYDLVSTRFYMGADEEMGMRFGSTRKPDRMRLKMLDQLERRLDSRADISSVGAELIERVETHWPDLSRTLEANTALRMDIGASILDRVRSLRRTS